MGFEATEAVPPWHRAYRLVSYAALAEEVSRHTRSA
jgi:hypothetical protein